VPFLMGGVMHVVVSLVVVVLRLLALHHDISR